LKHTITIKEDGDKTHESKEIETIFVGKDTYFKADDIIRFIEDELSRGEDNIKQKIADFEKKENEDNKEERINAFKLKYKNAQMGMDFVRSALEQANDNIKRERRYKQSSSGIPCHLGLQDTIENDEYDDERFNLNLIIASTK